MAVLLVGDSAAAVPVLLRRVGAHRKIPATVTALRYLDEVDTLAVSVNAPGWRGHKLEQFAFGLPGEREGAHTYTIASAWNPERPQLMGVIKALDDHTGDLRERLKVGRQIHVKGLYGCFTFDDDCPHQIWISAGVGITPFISRLHHMALQDQQARHDWPQGQRVAVSQHERRGRTCAGAAGRGCACCTRPPARADFGARRTDDRGTAFARTYPSGPKPAFGSVARPALATCCGAISPRTGCR